VSAEPKHLLRRGGGGRAVSRLRADPGAMARDLLALSPTRPSSPYLHTRPALPTNPSPYVPLRLAPRPLTGAAALGNHHTASAARVGRPRRPPAHVGRPPAAPPAAPLECRPRPERAERAERAPFVRLERPLVRTRPGETPPELGPAHHPSGPRPGGRERASGGAGARVSRPPAGRHRRSAPPAAAPEPRGEHASCARAAPKLFGAAESHARGRHGDVLRLRVRPRLGRRRGRAASVPMGHF